MNVLMESVMFEFLDLHQYLLIVHTFPTIRDSYEVRKEAAIALISYHVKHIKTDSLAASKFVASFSDYWKC